MLLRHAARNLLCRPGLSLVAIASLALGAGISAAIFALVNGVLLQPLPYHDSLQLYLVGPTALNEHRDPAGRFLCNAVGYTAWRSRVPAFSGLAAIANTSVAPLVDGEPRYISAARVTTNMFDVFGVRAELGRTLDATDDTHQTNVVITDAMWRGQFHADPTILGRQLASSGRLLTVVGVLPPAFHFFKQGDLGMMSFGDEPQAFLPLVFRAEELVPDNTLSMFNYYVIGRLHPGVAPAEAKAQLDVVQRDLASREDPTLQFRAELMPLRDRMVAGARSGLWMLLAAVISVVLIVCVNLGGLLVARVIAQQRDWAIRLALGASRATLISQMMLETAILGVCGGILGFAVTGAATRALIAYAPPDLPRIGEVHVGIPVLIFGLALSLIAGSACGTIPAWRLFRTDPGDSLKAGSAAASAGSRARVRDLLVVVEIAFSALLLVGASLLGMSLYRLLHVDAGIQTRQAVAADVGLGGISDDAQRLDAERKLVAAASTTPGVQAAALISRLPLSGETWIDKINSVDRPLPDRSAPMSNVRFIGPGYFSAMGVALLAGRDIRESDAAAGTDNPMVVISRRVAAALWPTDPLNSVIGRHFRMQGHVQTVIAVAADTRTALEKDPPLVVYQPYWIQPPYTISLVLRTPLPASAIAAATRPVIRGVAPTGVLRDVRTMTELELTTVASQTYETSLVLSFAALALLLAAMGVYAITAHSVISRTREVGIRVAIGARRSDIFRLVLAHSARVALVGAAAGLAVAAPLARLISALLFNVRPLEPAVYLIVGVLLLLTAITAGLLPACRATRIDVLVALRQD